MTSFRLYLRLHHMKNISYLSIFLPIIIALLCLMILHPLTFQLSTRYDLPSTIWRSREIAQIGTIESVSSLGRVPNDGHGFSSMVLLQPVWLVEVISFLSFLCLYCLYFLYCYTNFYKNIYILIDVRFTLH